MRIKRLEMKCAVRLPTLKFDVDLIEVGTETFKGLELELDTDNVLVLFGGQIVYLIPRENVAGMQPAPAVNAGLTMAELDAAPVPERLATAVAKSHK